MGSLKVCKNLETLLFYSTELTVKQIEEIEQALDIEAEY